VSGADVTLPATDERKQMTKVAANSTLVIAFVTALVALLTAFGVNITQDQLEAIVGVIAAALALLGLWFHPGVPVGNTSGDGGDTPTA